MTAWRAARYVKGTEPLMVMNHLLASHAWSVLYALYSRRVVEARCGLVDSVLASQARGHEFESAWSPFTFFEFCSNNFTIIYFLEENIILHSTTLASLFNQFLMQVFLMYVFLIVIQSFPLYKYCINYTLGSVSIIR